MAIQIPNPYLLFVGDCPEALSAKTAFGVAYWRKDICAGQLRFPGGVDVGLPDLTLAEAVQAGVQTLVIGIAPTGGGFHASWLEACRDVLAAGLNIASGLHTRLADISALADAAARSGATIFDVREPPTGLLAGTGRMRSGKRLLTVGTDCAVGKMFSALMIRQSMVASGMRADFRATGQTGILIEGSGIPIDAVVSDFISGAAEQLCPANDDDHWDIIEGQGSLFHPSCAGVTLGLIHGAQADELVICHQPDRAEISGAPGYFVPSLSEAIDAHLAAARLTNPAARMAGICLNTVNFDEATARLILRRIALSHDVPVVDPVRTGVDAIVAGLRERALA